MADVGSSHISVLFVCLGNTCRSTMAEAVFRSLAHSDPRFDSIDSAGTNARNGNPPDPRTIGVLLNNGVVDYNHRARGVTTDDFRRFDYIFALDREVLRGLQIMQEEVEGGKSKSRVELFGESECFNTGKPEEVLDPYFGDVADYEEVYGQVVRLSMAFLTRLEHRSVKRES